MTTPDLHPAADRLAALVSNIRDDQLTNPTPCPDYTLAALLDHVAGLAPAFAACARKDIGPLTSAAPMPDADNLPSDWRTTIPRDLAQLADAWSDPRAWTGMTQIGSVDVPGEVGGLIGLDEILVHGWDVARATGQPFEAADAELLAVMPFLQDAPDRSGALFGPVVEPPAGACLLDRVVGLAGRDPHWSPVG